MNCPCCQVELKMTDRQGIEVDYCPKCRGIWLDRGELDKLLERTNREAARYESDDSDHGEYQRPPIGNGNYSRQSDERPRYQSEPRYEPRQYEQRYPESKPYKKESLLSRLLDWD